MKMSPTSDATMPAEGDADDDADREIEDIALDGEILEFLQHDRAASRPHDSLDLFGAS